MPDGSKKSRMTLYREVDENSSFLTLPDLEGAEYVIQLLHEAGLMSSTGIGAVPLSWQEIEAWLRVTESTLSLWDKLMIKELSEAYVAELNQASAKDRPQPYIHVEEVPKIDREAVEKKLRNAFRSFKKVKRG